MSVKEIYPEYEIDYISEQMALRNPQDESLSILHRIMNITELSKETDNDDLLKKD